MLQRTMDILHTEQPALPQYDYSGRQVEMLYMDEYDLEECGYTTWRITASMADFYGVGEPMIVFSGGKGFHLIYPDFRTQLMVENYAPTKLLSEQKQWWSREARTLLINQMKTSHLVSEEELLLLDWEVTVDPRRIIRLPGTVHGKTLRVCKVITDMEGFVFDEHDKIVGYEADDPVG